MVTLGFLLGSAGLSLAILAWTKVLSLVEQIELLTKDLEKSGALKNRTHHLE